MTPKRNAAASRKVGIYVRISKDRVNEVSTDVQREACTKYATDRGWQVVDVFEDVGRSAFKANVKRPAFDELVAAVEDGRVDTLIAYKLDRVSRSVRDFANLAQTLVEHGAEFVSVTESFDTTTPMGRAMVSIASVFAELESAVKSERIGDALAHRRARGAPTNGPRPFGLTQDRGKLEPTEARLIRQAAKRVLAGDSLRQIVGAWNDKGVTTARGGDWNRHGLAHVLTSPTTAGLRDVDGVLVEGTMPAVLDRETWDTVRGVLTDPSRRTGDNNGRVHLLTGVVTCGRCGTPMSTKPHRAGWRYVCAPRKGYDACGGVSIDGAQTDALVGAALAYEIEHSAVIRAAVRRPRSHRNEAAEIADDLETLAVDFGAGRLTRREWEAARTGLERRLTEAEEARTSGRDTAALNRLVGARDLSKAWTALDVTGQRAVLRILVERASVNPAIPGRGFDPDRIELAWRV